MKNQLSAAALLIAMLQCSNAWAIGASWTAADTGAKTAAGTLGPVSFSMTNVSNPSVSASGSDFSGPDFAAAPLSNSESALSNFGVGSSYMVNFSLPVSHLLIYAMFWRGNGSGVSPTTYTFNHPVAIVSGFAGASASGNTLSIPDGFKSGILQFQEPVGTLSVAMNTSVVNQGQIMSFGVVPFAPTVQISGAVKPKTRRSTYTLRGIADATYGVQAVKIKAGKSKGFKDANGTAKWNYRVKLVPGRNKVQIQATSNTGELSAITRVVIIKK